VNKKYKIWLVGAAVVLFLNIVCVIVCTMHYPHFRSLLPLDMLLYFVIAYEAAKQWDFKVAVTLTTILGIFDAAVGCLVSVLFDLKSSEFPYKMNLTTWLFSTLVMIAVSTFIALLASGLAAILAKKKNTAE